MLYSRELDISVITVTMAYYCLSGVCMLLSFIMSVGYSYIRYILSAHEMITIPSKTDERELNISVMNITIA